MALSRPLFFTFVFLIQLIKNKICQWLDLNHGSLVLEATALPTEPQSHHCPIPLVILQWHHESIIMNIFPLSVTCPRIECMASQPLKLISLQSQYNKVNIATKCPLSYSIFSPFLAFSVTRKNRQMSAKNRPIWSHCLPLHACVCSLGIGKTPLCRYRKRYFQCMKLIKLSLTLINAFTFN